MSLDSSRPYGAARRTGRDDPATLSDRIRFRRSLTLMVMTLLVPGSAQLVCGNRRVGHLAVRIWATVVLAVVTVVVLGLTWRGPVITLLTDNTVLTVLRLGLVALAVGWAVLFLDAWRIGDPLGLRRGHRLAMVCVNTALCTVTGGALLFSAHVVAVQKDFINTVFGSGEAVAAAQGRYNILLLGGDSGPTRFGLRPDSITLASIDAESGRTVLFGLPRNLENVPFPEGTVMAEQFPDGFDCDGCYLNGVYTWAEDHPELFPGVKNPGLQATFQAVEGITGLELSYYAMINIGGFQRLIDAVGGITLTIPEDTPIGDVNGNHIDTIPAGRQHLDGYHALWYARSRLADSDYARMARQKCVMNAMLHQLNPQTVMLKVKDIAEAGKSILQTDVPRGEIDTFLDLALKSRNEKVSTVSFVPPTIQTYDPDYGLITSMVSDAIAKAEGTSTPAPGKTRKKGPASAEQRIARINAADDLAASC